MRTTRTILALALTLSSVPAMAVTWDTPESRARWAELNKEIYGADASHLQKAGNAVTIDAPDVAQDAALVPVTIKLGSDVKAKELDLVIDQNPSPVAAKVLFGPAADDRLMSFRVRVNAFTNMHAVAHTADGKLLESVVFVQGSGGCSAPMGMSEAEASANMGEMKMRFGTDASLGDAAQAKLMIRHPNFNGMQMNQTTKKFTPARFIKSIDVKEGDDLVFHMTTDISLSTNPVLTFLYKREEGKPFKVTVVDSSNATWTKQFEPPPMGQRVER